MDTTLHKTLAISTEGDTQLVFFDTPGIVDPFKKTHYADSLLRDPHTVLAKADIIVVVVDVSQKLTRSAIHPEIIKVTVEEISELMQPKSSCFCPRRNLQFFKGGVGCMYVPVPFSRWDNFSTLWARGLKCFVGPSYDITVGYDINGELMMAAYGYEFYP